MTIRDGMVVRAKRNNIFEYGRASAIGSYIDPVIWWVQFDSGAVEAYEEEDLIRWNAPEIPCDCGSRTLGHPGHSQWCGSLTSTRSDT